MAKYCLDCKKIKSSLYSLRCHSCSNKLNYKKRIEYKGGISKKPHYCIDCGQRVSSYKTKRCRYCSMQGKNHPSYKGGLPICIDCGKQLSYYRGKRCKSCAVKNDKNPNWHNGISKLPYSFEFTDELKEKIRKRDNYQCQNKECNMTEEEHLIVYGKNISIHHIDYNKKNCEESNLLPLCFQCNSRANHNRPHWTQYFKDIAKSRNVFHLMGKDLI